MKLIGIVFIFFLTISIVHAQKVGIGNTTPAAKLDIRGLSNSPTIPGVTSTGVLRIGVNALEGIDIGKMALSPYSGWMQAGYDSNHADPLSLQPLGGNVSIGTINPVSKLDIRGLASNPSIPGLASTGILRLGVSATDGIDIGKMGFGPYSGWIQAGTDGNYADPLSLQPLGGNVGIGTTSPVTSAVLDINSTTKGFLPPRMTLVNRNSIATPVEGLMIWCNNCGVYGQIQVFNGFTWTNMIGGKALGVPVIGDSDGGGIIAYILQAGDPGYVAGEVHGLIAAPTNQSTNAEWGCSGTAITGANGQDIGTGNQNTIDIMSECLVFGIAAQICGSAIINGYSDWYLPSKDELNKLYINREAIGGFDGFFYWSSSEGSNTYAWSQFFSDGTQTPSLKIDASRVRAIRSF